MNQSQQLMEMLGGMSEGKAETFAKKAASLASSVKITSSKSGTFTKGIAKGSQLTLGLTNQVDAVFKFEDDSDMPGSVVVTNTTFSGASQSAQFTKTIFTAVNQKQFKNPMDFLKKVAKAI